MNFEEFKLLTKDSIRTKEELTHQVDWAKELTILEAQKSLWKKVSEQSSNRIVVITELLKIKGMRKIIDFLLLPDRKIDFWGMIDPTIPLDQVEVSIIEAYKQQCYLLKSKTSSSDDKVGYGRKFSGG